MLFDLDKLMRNAFSAAAVALLCAVAAPAANASAIYDNIGSSQDGADPLLSYGPLANSFSTGANGAGYLSGVSVLLKNGSNSQFGDIQVSLHADGGNVPGATELVSLGTLSSVDVSTAGFAEYDFTPLTAFLLAANTMYWIEITTQAAAVEWSWSYDPSALGVAGQYSYSSILGTNPSSAGAYQMAVNVSQVPEPESLALMLLGLGLVVVVKRRR